jgi:hypothetical protein
VISILIFKKSLFNDEYYQNPDPKDELPDEDEEKPVFTDDDEEDLKCNLIIFKKLSLGTLSVTF